MLQHLHYNSPVTVDTSGQFARLSDINYVIDHLNFQGKLIEQLQKKILELEALIPTVEVPTNTEITNTKSTKTK